MSACIAVVGTQMAGLSAFSEDWQWGVENAVGPSEYSLGHARGSVPEADPGSGFVGATLGGAPVLHSAKSHMTTAPTMSPRTPMSISLAHPVKSGGGCLCRGLAGLRTRQLSVVSSYPTSTRQEPMKNQIPGEPGMLEFSKANITQTSKEMR